MFLENFGTSAFDEGAVSSKESLTQNSPTIQGGPIPVKKFRR